MIEPSPEPLATVVLRPRAAQRLRNFYLAVYRDEIADLFGSPAHGDLVLLQSPEGENLGIGFYSGTSRIAVRLVSRDPREKVDEAFFRRRLERAWRWRQRWVRGTNAFRVVHAEADGLPGLIVDWYNGHAVVQCRIAGMERRRELWLRALEATLAPQSVYERSDLPVRQEEGLEPFAGPLLGEPPEVILIEENGLLYGVDVRLGSKTGFFLDQRDARRLVRQEVVPGEEVLDLFSFTGGFALNAAAAGASAVAVEWNERACQLAQENARRNGLEARVQVRCLDAFAALAEYRQQGKVFDWVIADPPALAKEASEARHWQRFLVKVAAEGLRVLRPEGKLFLFSCAYHLGPETLLGGLRIAAGDLGRRLFVLAETRQALDHPWLLQIPETLYLKGVLVVAEEGFPV